jgi:hypothetical protein
VEQLHKKSDWYLHPIYRDLAERYKRICEENNIVWKNFEEDCIEASKNECLKNGNYTKK